ncbi:MAG: fumarate hydratase C-terminal domain-containing protein [Clostridia bacterium]|nr:fumarate hydratase C-terminal domain-containing protein [Clostridia bacterium]
MTEPKSFRTEELRARVSELRAGDSLRLSGTVYTARDAAHKRILAAIEAGEELPFPLKDAVIYYAGPTAAPPGHVIGACGPTTASRMDPFAPRLLDLGLAAMIGKGERSPEVVEAVRRNRALYLCAIGGAGALAARHITACEVIAYPELGCESVKRLTFADFPLICAIDAEGNDLFREGRKTYAK